ncbi:MAG: hypothetical protein KKD29_06910 [Candidatus Omnitrophica bacterium]|nr:hypothetical protein [Candidatus Omnitrophota bacterium]MBU4488798.1 hypothetical protein [Candidatus Omnitrophota bacterium]MCG2705455.1 hypothetical protein [Candidatus Omnitrophota bacterium]
MYVDIEIYKSNDNVYIACCPELNLYANANTQGEAATKLKKKISDFIDKHDSSFEANKDIDYTVKYYSARYPQTH